MAAVSLTVKSVRCIGQRGFEVSLEDSRGLTESLEFASRRDARDELHSIMDDDAVKKLLRAVVIARGLRLTADGDTADDLDSLVGRVVTFNLRAPQNLLRIV